MTRKRLAAIGGGLAGSVLVVFGVIAIAMGVNGVQTVHDNLAQENIVGTRIRPSPGRR